ncbi:hypothetical protein PPL_08629 [Heterostelium album PN500]|uniref:PPPDE domain-containing protein n=1 Tax=Heterostelium pallidum (strain ATCC 26659 / Pp 5 / PN500) TaxID=670386 RepID=D3BJA4_HETP5|nr:hypothetical protein PPL_08629 [Heterostelium album PN500]EFA77984.1 hypothetical protein PPL_08629 [Heterostelium album PN500]|eukprot:XP_020430112.1 hypothetical protein PPL_08629 [Heterostelium album PN500]
MSEIVSFYVHDLSRGLATNFLKQNGVDLQGLYHTSIAVFNKEYFFGQGVKSAEAGKTEYGSENLSEKIVLGRTKKTEEEFTQFLNGLSASKYPVGSHDAFENNCNHFCNDLTQYLLNGKKIPDRIGKYTDKIKGSPFEPVFRSMFKQYVL